MPSVTISHITLTFVLLVAVMPILVVFETYSMYSLNDALRYELVDVTDYVSSTTVDLVVLAGNTGAEEMNITKSIQLPESLGQYGYTVELQNKMGQWYVVAYLDEKRYVEGETLLPLGEGIAVDSSAVIHSGMQDSIVWCKRTTSDGVRLEVGFGG